MSLFHKVMTIVYKSSTYLIFGTVLMSLSLAKPSFMILSCWKRYIPERNMFYSIAVAKSINGLLRAELACTNKSSPIGQIGCGSKLVDQQAIDRFQKFYLP